MPALVQTLVFSEWTQTLRDDRAKAKIAVRIDRLMLGNSGDAKPVGGGVREMRIDYGPGYRVYFAQQGDIVVIVLLCGGTKKSQPSDIKDAKRLFEEWKEARQ